MSDYSTYSDAQLVDAFLSGDESAFEELYLRYWEKLLYIAAKKIKSLPESENIVQDVFLDIWERRTILDINQNVAGYLAAAVRYRVINYLAKQHRIASHQTDLAQHTDKPDQSFNNWLSFHDLEQWLVEKVSNLPEKCGLAFRLRQQGYTQKEIAQEMNISEKTVEMHIGKALKSLRTSFGQLIVLLLLLPS